jgi:RND family efflux transporter MFP subunit
MLDTQAPHVTDMEVLPRRRQWWRQALRTLVTLLVLALAAALVTRKLLAPVPAIAGIVERGDVVEEAFGRGTLESRREVEIGFDLVGRLEQVLVEEGDWVVKGQPLAKLDLDQLAAQRYAAQTNVVVAKSAIARLDAEEQKASAALAFAETEAARASVLQASGALSTRDLDSATDQRAQHRAELERVRAERAEIVSGIAAANSNALVSNTLVARGVLLAPFDGQIVRRLREPGDTVSVGSTVLRLVERDSLRSRAWLDDSVLSKLSIGQPARIRFGIVGSALALGHIERIGYEADRQTHEIWVDVIVVDLPARTAVGQRTDVWLEVGRSPHTIRIANRFVRWEGEAAYCFVDRGGKIARAPLTLGRRSEDFVEVTAGVAEGDLVLGAPDAGKLLPEGRKYVVQP